jgi:hypothetical protein
VPYISFIWFDMSTGSGASGGSSLPETPAKPARVGYLIVAHLHTSAEAELSTTRAKSQSAAATSGTSIDT